MNVERNTDFEEENYKHLRWHLGEPFAHRKRIFEDPMPVIYIKKIFLSTRDSCSHPNIKVFGAFWFIYLYIYKQIMYLFEELLRPLIRSRTYTEFTSMK